MGSHILGFFGGKTVLHLRLANVPVCTVVEK